MNPPAMGDQELLWPEFQIGLWALDVIEKRLGLRPKEDEAGFIALHIVNANLHSDE